MQAPGFSPAFDQKLLSTAPAFHKEKENSIGSAKRSGASKFEGASLTYLRARVWTPKVLPAVLGPSIATIMALNQTLSLEFVLVYPETQREMYSCHDL
jgi:hypothetical protein